MASSTATLEPKTRLRLNPGMVAWLGLVGVLLLVGIVAAIQVFWHGLEITNMSDNVPWGLWITIDLSAIALGAGAFTLSAVVYLFGIKRFQPIVRLAVLIGFIGYTAALLTLVMDIGRPDRFWHPWAFWNIHSVLWEITWCITIYLVIMLVEFLPVIAESPLFARWPKFRILAHDLHKAAPVLALLGLLISLLHQSSLGATYGIVKARPIWFKPSMPIMFILSAVAVGPALTMAVAYTMEWITAKRTIDHDILNTIARFSGFGLLIYGYLRFWDAMAVLYYGSTPSVQEAWAVLQENTPYTFSFWVLEIVLGIIVPAVLFLVPRFNKRPVLLVIGAGLAVMGIIINRWNVTVSGLTVPMDYSPGTLYVTPVGHYFPNLPEWGIAIGIIGYAFLMLTFAAAFLPLFRSTEKKY